MMHTELFKQLVEKENDNLDRFRSQNTRHKKTSLNLFTQQLNIQESKLKVK